MPWSGLKARHHGEVVILLQIPSQLSSSLDFRGENPQFFSQPPLYTSQLVFFLVFVGPGDSQEEAGGHA